jgi:hypothetical protein
MRFRILKTVTAIVILIVLLVCVCVALVRKFVFPAPPGNHHACVGLLQTKTINLESWIQENHTGIRLAEATL